jgi:P4 family phage/plasmid primase-like protien
VSEQQQGEATTVSAHHWIDLNAGIDLNPITDTTNAGLFVHLFEDTVRYITDEKRWAIWNGFHWQPDTREGLAAFALTQSVIQRRKDLALETTGENRDALLQAITKLEAVDKRRAMLSVAKSDPRIQLELHNFDESVSDFVVPNGTVDLRTFSLRSAQPNDMNSLCAGVEFIPEAVEPGYSVELELFLETFIPDPECQAYVFKLLGHSLYVGNDLRILPVFFGGTTSGKSQFFAALQQIFGSYACAISPGVFRSNLDDKPRPDLVRAMFKRIAYATEGSKSWALHADQVKRLTGGSDSLPYRDLYAGIIEHIPRFVAMIVANEFPRISGIDVATRRRILSIHMDQTLPPEKEDPAIRARFLADVKMRQALLARVIFGASLPLARDLSDMPEKYRIATDQARQGMGHLAEFIEWALNAEYLAEISKTIPASGCARTTDLYDIYRYWIKGQAESEDRKDPLGSKGFSQALEGIGWEKTRSNGARWVGWTLPQGVPLMMKIV